MSHALVFTTGAVAADAAGAVGTSAWAVHIAVPAAVAALELLVAVEVVLAAALAETFAKGPRSARLLPGCLQNTAFLAT